MSTSSGRDKARQRTAASAARGRRRPRARSSGRLRRALRLLWDLSPLLLVLFVFAVGLTLDPAGAAQLLWACVSGDFGEPVQIASSISLLCIAGVTLWAFRPQPSDSPSRGKPGRRQTTRAKAAKRTAEGGAREQDAVSAAPGEVRMGSTPEPAGLAAAPLAPPARRSKARTARVTSGATSGA